MQMIKYCLLLIFIFCMEIIQAAPQPTVILTNESSKLSLASHMDILEDPKHTLSIQQVITPDYSEQFQPNTQKTPNFGRTRSAYWVRFTLLNQSDLKWYTRINSLLGQDVVLYVFDADKRDISNDITRNLPDYGPHAWSLTLPKQKPLTFYLRASNGDSILSLPIELFSSDAFIEQTRQDHNLYASIIAALLIMAIYNLLSFVVLRESSYLTLAIHIASVAAILQITRPVYAGLDFLQDTGSHFFTAPIYIAVISFLIFCRQLLKTQVSTPTLDKLILGITIVSAGLTFVTGWVPQGTYLPQLMFVLAFVLILVASVIGSYQGNRIAKYFLFIFAIILLMVIPNAVVNVVAAAHWQSAKLYSTGLATLVFLLLLSLVQSEKIRGWREQEQRASVSKEATDNFLMNISHELRTPVQALIGIGELFRKTPLNPTQQNYLQKQEYASQHLLDVVNDILDLGAMSRGTQAAHTTQERFNLDRIIDDITQLLSVSAEQKGLTLRVYITPTDCPTLLGDAGHLKQVLLNLLDNAIKYTDKGGVKLDIVLSNTTHPSMMTVHFEISDTGIGIPNDQHPHLFKPFFQVESANRRRSGSGLGLAISYQLVKQMGGELQLRNQNHAGTCFFFTLNFPILSETEQAETTVRKNIDATMLMPGIHLLFVEDDPLNQLIGQKLLTAKGAIVTLAGTGSDAIRQMQQQPSDVVLMDLDLPDMNGYEATRIIRADKNIPNRPIIALTAHAIGGEEEKCLNAGMNDYLAKPYAIDELIEIILKHVDLTKM